MVAIQGALHMGMSIRASFGGGSTGSFSNLFRKAASSIRASYCRGSTIRVILISVQEGCFEYLSFILWGVPNRVILKSVQDVLECMVSVLRPVSSTCCLGGGGAATSLRVCAADGVLWPPSGPSVAPIFLPLTVKSSSVCYMVNVQVALSRTSTSIDVQGSRAPRQLPAADV